MLYIKAGTASMAGAWFIHWPVRPVHGLYGPDHSTDTDYHIMDRNQLFSTFGVMRSCGGCRHMSLETDEMPGISVVLARYRPKGKRYDTVRYHTKYRGTIRCINATSNLMHSNTGVSSSKNICCYCSGCEPGRYSRTTIAAKRPTRAHAQTMSNKVIRGRQCRSATTRYRHRRQWRRHCGWPTGRQL